MIIGGLQKLTLLDFPGYVACTVFTEGCNFRCPFCHNALLVVEEKKEFDDKMSEYTAKLQTLFGEGNALQAEIMDQLKKVKYE